MFPYRQSPPCGHWFVEPGQQVQFVPATQQLGPVPQWVLPGGHAQVPFWQVKSPLHTVPQLPQFCRLLLVFTHVPLHQVCPEGHLETQAPHWQFEPQVSVPPPFMQDWVAPGLHTPWPVQADHADHVPPLQVRVCVPQFPHRCELGPEQAQMPFTQLDPEGQHRLLLPHGAAPLGHRHTPFTQVVPVGQTLPHAPQFWLSVCRFLQARRSGN
jgi:hypothetical protein